MKNWKTRLFAMLVTVLMTCSLLPATAMAAKDIVTIGAVLDGVRDSTLEEAEEAALADAEKIGFDGLVKTVYVDDHFPGDDFYAGNGEWIHTPACEGDDTTWVIVPVYYHANYDYSDPTDDVVALVYYILPSCNIDWGWPLETADSLGFTETGYVQNADDPWSYAEGYWHPGYMTFGFKGDNLFGDQSEDADSKVGYFCDSDGESPIHIRTNWKEKGDPVDVPDPVKPKPEYPELTKKVDGGDSTSAAAGEDVEFTLTSRVPRDLWKCFDFSGTSTVMPASLENQGKTIDGAKYELTFHDVMDRKLTMTDAGVSVRIGDDRTLAAGNYTYTADTGDGCTFHVTLDLVDLYEKNIVTDADYAAQTPITVTYAATLADDATAGVYKNEAWVDWEKIVDREDPHDPPDDPPIEADDPDDPPEHDEVEVYTYKIQLTKTDKSTKALLSGATFKLEMLTDEETDTWELVGEQKTTGEDGIVSWDGLDEGTYRLTETDAPAGYIIDTRPVTVKLPADAGDTKTAAVSFTNGTVPHTGGSGTAVYTVAGLAILCCAAGVLLVSRKKKSGQ